MATWKHTLNITEEHKNAYKYTPQVFGGIIADRIVNSTFYSERDEELQAILFDLKNSNFGTFDDFDAVWERFYDYADKHKIWVRTF